MIDDAALSCIEESIFYPVEKKPTAPESVWIDTAGLPNAIARGYEHYYLTSPSDTNEFGPSDGESVEYLRKGSDKLRHTAITMFQFGVLQKSKRRWVVIKLNHTTGHADFQVPQFETFSRDFDSGLDANAECRRLWLAYNRPRQQEVTE